MRLVDDGLGCFYCFGIWEKAAVVHVVSTYMYLHSCWVHGGCSNRRINPGRSRRVCMRDRIQNVLGSIGLVDWVLTRN